MTLNFSRLHHQRPGYGYAGVPDPWRHVPEPRDDGIYRLDLETGAQRLVIPTALLAGTRRKPTMEGAVHRFNHLQFSPDGRALHLPPPLASRRRATCEGTSPASVPPTRTAQIALLADEDLVSHFDWRDPQHVLAWARHGGVDAFWLLHDPLAPPTGRLRRSRGAGGDPRDGHCSYSPDGARRWIANDTYPDAERTAHALCLYTQTGRRSDLGRFYSPPELTQDSRVDLHPRWSRDGARSASNSAHEGSRQLYVADAPA